MRLKTFSQTSLLATSLLLSTGLLVGCGDERAKDESVFVDVEIEPVTTNEVKASSAIKLAIVDPYAANSNTMLEEDKAYKADGAVVANLGVLKSLSDDNYDNNRYGLITHATLRSWIEDWGTNKPAGITGKLVILQQGEGAAGAKYIKPDNTNVFTYVESGWLTTRSDGVMRSTSFVPNGETMDKLFAKYGIDATKDMIVCAQGAGGTSTYMSQGRCWYTLTYWGVDQKNIAVLNGNNAYLKRETSLVLTDDTVDGKHPSPIIQQQKSSVKNLPNGSAIHASLKDVIDALPTTDAKGDGILLWDARSLPQYSAGKYSWVNGEVQEATYSINSFQNNAARQSHPRGALNLEFTNLMNVADGLYHEKGVLETLVKGGSNTSNGQSFVDGSYAPVGAGNAYQEGDTIIHYCETSMRAAITIVATGVILGYDSRLFDGAMQEWNSLTAGAKDKNGQVVLPADSPWNTEYLSYPVGVYGNDTSIGGSADYIAIRSLEGWAYQLTAEKQAAANEAAKEAAKKPGQGSGSTGGGSILPSNPCGG